MKVFVSADLEGVAGVVHSAQMDQDKVKRLMTQEVNAAIEGALEAGAEEVLVNDSHGAMRNIMLEELHEGAELIIGSPKPLSMMQGIDESFDAALFIGYHAKRGSYLGVLEHTYHGGVVSDIAINGRQMGEVGINAALAGYFNVPVVLVTGDRAVVEEAKSLLGDVEVAMVKEGVGRFAARCLSPSKAQRLIKEKAFKALSRLGSFKPFIINPPIELEVSFIHTGMIEMAELLPGVRRMDGRSLSITLSDYLEAFKALRAMITLAGTNV